MKPLKPFSPAVAVAIATAVGRLAHMNAEMYINEANTNPTQIHQASRTLALLPETTLRDLIRTLPSEIQINDQKIKTLMADLAPGDCDSTCRAGVETNSCYVNCYANCHSNRSWR